jgi:hypothetical protein
MNTDARQSIAKLYYYVTPVFVLLDYLAGVNVRVAVLDSMPLHKSLYYGFCVVCAVSMYAAPRYTAVVALFESAINFSMTTTGLFVPYARHIAYTDDVLNADWELANVFTTPRIVNLILAGVVAILVFKGSLRTLGVDTIRRRGIFNEPPDSDTG